MTGVQILAITRPEDLFPGDLDRAKRIYHKLAMQWHPDRVVGVDPAVFAHIASLFEQAEEKLKRGLWEGSSSPVFDLQRGDCVRLNAQSASPFPLGFSYVSDRAVTYAVDKMHVTKFVPRVAGLTFTFASNRMATEIQRYLPAKHLVQPLADGRSLVQVAKTDDLLKLRDVVTHTGPLDPKHTAWIISSLMNLCCYLSHVGLVHHDISPDTYFISPSHHSGALLGGWWFWHQQGDVLGLIPRRTADVLPFTVRRDKVANPLTDLELVRLLAREISAPMPEPMRSWVETPGSTSAVNQYQEWIGVREKTFGHRRFTPMLIDAATVYKAGATVI